MAKVPTKGLKAAKLAVKPLEEDLLAVRPEVLEGADSPLLISTRRPSPKNFAVYGDPEQKLLIQTGEALKAAPEAFEKNMLQLTEEPFMASFASRDPEKIYDEAIRRGAGNLKFIAEELMSPEKAAASQRWYNVAHDVSGKKAQEVGLPPQAGYGVTAITSPQTMWDINVARMMRLMDMYKDKFSSLSPEERKRAMEWIDKRMESGSPGAVASKGKEYLTRVGETPMSQLTDPFERYSKVVLSDAVRNPYMVPSISVSGEFGKDVAPITWGSANQINAALDIMNDPSMKNISSQMTGGGKVPSFYNNIAVPESSLPISTIDTHSAGAASLFPGGGKDSIVYRAMGIGAPPGSPRLAAADSAVTGSKGLYGPVSEMHNVAAKELGVLPRAVQSITWEGVRDLWGQEGKTAALKTAVDNIWRTSKTPDEARARIAELFGKPLSKKFAVK